MRLERIDVDLLEIPLRSPLDTAAGTWESRRLGLVSLGTDTGVKGLGEIASELPQGIRSVDAALLRVALLGLDLADDGALTARLAEVDGHPALGRPLRAAVESAVVDVRARAAGSSVATWLGEQLRTSVRLNAFIGIADADTAAQTARSQALAGFTCLKLKAADEPTEAIVARLTAVRAAVGTSMGLRLDLNGSLSPDRAQRLLEIVAPFGLEYVEQPLAVAAGVEAMARLRRTSPVPIAADESLAGPDSSQRLLDAAAVDVFVLKPARVGGLLSAARIARTAAASGVSVTISTLFESGVGIAGALQLAASLPDDAAHGLATADLLTADLLVHPLIVRDGAMALPGGPGLGVELDAAALGALRC